MTADTAPLVATADEQTLDDALRWCAAAGTIPDVAHDLTSMRRAWRQASAVILGEDLAGAVARADLGRRDHVVLIAREPASWWSAAVGIGATAVCAPHEEARVIDVLTAALDGAGEACVVAFVGAVGGAGASTLSASLAVTGRRRGLRSLLVDADPWGGGLELVLGAEGAQGMRWPDFGSTDGRIGAGSLADVLPEHRGVTSLSWDRGDRPRLPDSTSTVLGAAARGFDLVVADVPRQLDERAREVVGRAVLTLLVVPEEVRAVAAAGWVAEALHDCAPRVGLVTVSRPGGIGSAPVADALGLPVMARHRLDRRLRAAIDRGHGPGRSRSARRTSSRLLDALGLESA